MNGLVALFWLWGGAIGAVGIGIAYFWLAEDATSKLIRLSASSYSPATTLLFISAAVAPEAWRELGRSSYLIAYTVPAVLLVYSLVAYPGPRRVHLWLLPLAAVFALWQLGIGTLAIYGK
jgi:hypothetical protein